MKNKTSQSIIPSVFAGFIVIGVFSAVIGFAMLNPVLFFGGLSSVFIASQLPS